MLYYVVGLRQTWFGIIGLYALRNSPKALTLTKGSTEETNMSNCPHLRLFTLTKTSHSPLQKSVKCLAVANDPLLLLLLFPLGIQKALPPECLCLISAGFLRIKGRQACSQTLGRKHSRTNFIMTRAFKSTRNCNYQAISDTRPWQCYVMWFGSVCVRYTLITSMFCLVILYLQPLCFVFVLFPGSKLDLKALVMMELNCISWHQCPPY